MARIFQLSGRLERTLRADDPGGSCEAPDPAHGPDVERLRLVYGNFPLALGGSVTAGCVLVALLYETVPHGTLLMWLTSLLVVCGLRLLECLAFRRAPKRRAPRAWIARLQLGSAVAGLVWGTGAMVFLGVGELGYQLFALLVFSGVAAGAMTSYGAIWRGYLAFLLPFQTLLELRLILDHTALHGPLAVINLLFVCVMLYSAFKTDQAFGNVLAITAENAKLTRALRYQATHDPLVDLVNHREFNTRLLAAADGAVIGKHPCALLYIDLDRFKEVNDQGGHAAGDETLRRVSLILKEHIRATDTAARLGGDEFAILLPGCSRERAESVARGVLESIRDFVLHREGGLYFRVGASIGVAYAAPGEVDASSLVRVADAACYAAKNAGRGRVEVRRARPLAAPDRFETEALRRSV